MLPHQLSTTNLLLCLYACTKASSATVEATRAGYSVGAVKVAQSVDQRQPSLLRRGDDQITVSIGSQWYLPVQIGHPPQSFLMTPDSGAPSLAVQSVFLPSNETDNSPSYDPSKSSTASKLDGYTYSNCFGSGHCGNGVVYNDTVTVGNLSVQMPFEVSVSNNGVSNGAGSNSGNFGLNYDQKGMTTAPQKLPSWLQTVLPLCTDRVFTMDFNETSFSGTIDFGFIDNEKYSGGIGYTPVVGTGGQWSVTFSGFQVGSSGSFNNSQSWNAIVDSGTAKSALPKFVVDGYFQQIPGATYDSNLATYKFPCSTVLPDFIFGVDGNTTYRGVISLQGANVGNNTCTTKLKVGTGTVIFGQDFIESQFVVFDYGNGRVGFANKGSTNSSNSNSPQPSSSSGGSSQKSDAINRSISCLWQLLVPSILLAMMLPFI